MTELSRAQIADLTGLPPSSLTRALARFPGARSGRGRYSTSDPAFNSWLGQQQGVDAVPEAAERVPGWFKDKRGEPWVMLPSGFILMSEETWTRLRSAPEAEALAVLDMLIGCWQLRPHDNVPDLLPFLEMRLPSGLTVNAWQWRVLRGKKARAATAALDVLIRRFPGPPGAPRRGRTPP